MFGSSSAMRILPGIGLRGARLAQLRGGGRKSEQEAGALARAALDPHAAAEVLDDLAADVQPEPAAVRLAGQRIADLAELVEDDELVRRVDAVAVVAHADRQAAVARLERDLDPAAARRAE